MTQQYNFIEGTDGRDNIEGTSGADIITGNSSGDTIHGGDGDDIIAGSGCEPGNLFEEDRVYGGGGKDLFIAGDGQRAYYTANGENDCVIINDFNALEDSLQLHGSAEDYTFEITDGVNVVISYQGEMIVLLRHYLIENDTEFDLNNPDMIKYVEGDEVICHNKGALGDKVWYDLNRNGIQDEGEEGVEGVTVTLTGGGEDGVIGTDDDTTATTTTDAEGNYRFDDLTPGVEYQVNFSNLPENYTFTSENVGSDDTLDSDVDVTTGSTEIITLAPGEYNKSVDAGIVENLASLGDKVFFDSDRDGIQDAGEEGVEGVTVTLTGGGADGLIGTDDDTTATTTTDGEGNYRFDDLTPGVEYQVNFSNLPQDYIFTTENAGSDDTLDSDVDPTTGSTEIITLAPGEYNDTLDAGIVLKPASLGDRVWYDIDGDGIQDAGEEGVEGVTVTLTGGGTDGVIGTDDDTTATTTTNGDGNYNFGNLNGGEEYKVTFSNLPDGYEFTKVDAVEVSEEVIFESSFESAPNAYFTSDPLEGWQSQDGYIEIRRHGSADGHKHIELNDDAIDYYNDASQIYRDIATEAGKEYTLTFQYAARPGFSEDVNAMEVRLDGSTLLAVAEDGSHNSGYDWQTYTVSFEGDGSTKQLEFLSTGTAVNYGRGAHLDDIKLIATSGENDDTLDSDANPTTGMSQIITLAPGEHNDTIDAGIVKTLPKTGTIIGSSHILEGNQAHYQVKLDGVVSEDTYVTVNIDNGTAKQADGYHLEQVKSLSNPYTHNVSLGEQGQLYSANTHDRNYAAHYWNGTHWFTGDLNELPIGADNLTDDFEVTGAQGDKIVVKIEAGSDTSESFEVSALKEIQLGKMFSGEKSTESKENFSLNIEKIGDHDVHTGEKTIDIYDNYANYSPIAFDLNDDGIQTLSIKEGVEFDMLNSGKVVNTGWLSGEDGFLAVDNDGDGLISSRAELFGGEVGEGFAKLKTFDSNKDGLVNESDSLFGSLKLWQDANENGITDEGELVSLESAGITDLNTGYEDVFATDVHGNVHGEHSSALKDGGSVDMVDVYFQVAI